MNHEKRKAVVSIAGGALVVAMVLSTSVYAIVRANTLTDCNKRVIINLEKRSQFSSKISALDDRRNAALLKLLQASSAGSAQAFVTAVQEGQEWSVARELLLEALTNPKSRESTSEAARTYAVADEEQKELVRERDRIKLPKLDDCL